MGFLVRHNGFSLATKERKAPLRGGRLAPCGVLLAGSRTRPFIGIGLWGQIAVVADSEAVGHDHERRYGTAGKLMVAYDQAFLGGSIFQGKDAVYFHPLSFTRPPPLVQSQLLRLIRTSLQVLNGKVVMNVAGHKLLPLVQELARGQ